MSNHFENLIAREDEFIANARNTEQQILRACVNQDATVDSSSSDSAYGETAQQITEGGSTSGTAEKTSVPTIQHFRGVVDTQNSPGKVSLSRSYSGGSNDLDEPWLEFSSNDRVGLAFSGGGIRSATYNLGLLQGLNNLNLLQYIDYLSTVSGGGYIGAWWTAWRSRRAPTVVDRFPATTSSHVVEPNEVRHLRRFSNYLVPRIGLLDVEFWNGVTAVLSGFLPAFGVATSILVVGVWAWLSIGWLFLGTQVGSSTIALCLFALSIFTGGELWWRWDKQSKTDTNRSQSSLWAYVCYSVLAVAGIGLSRWAVYWCDRYLPSNPAQSSPVTFLPDLHIMTGRGLAWLFLPTAIFLVVIAVLIVLQFLGIIAGSAPNRTRPDDLALRRVLGRLAFMVLIWSILAVLWFIATLIHDRKDLIVATGGTSGLALAIFTRLRTWITRSLQPGRQPGFAKLLRSLVPQFLAYVALLTAVVLVCVAVQSALTTSEVWKATIAIPMVVILLALFLFDPVNCGLHAFYRDRLCRAYLGASNKELSIEANDFAVDVDPADDLEFADIRSRNCLPLHLVCCAANELNVDPLANFSRGARSATLSAVGLSIANAWDSFGGISLASAITASAAAFNSNMGSVSKQLGRAVSFLMCALNLRLGLWVPRPGAKRRSFWPKGWPFFLEMWGATRQGRVHLSDGGHFENLALYELIRRHCRYVIVSDVGADPDVAFDDLGNAIRRVREDFGVDIELDVAPLRPGENGLAQQHMVVGTIHYDHSPAAKTRADKGILLYFKPGLTGDEPMDVRQYHSRNAAFPNETTIDQFYDEAQWEAYRRLGEHAAQQSLGFVTDLPLTGRNSNDIDEVFGAARWKWYPTPPELPRNMLELTARFVSFEDRLRMAGPPEFVGQIYPELAGTMPSHPIAETSMLQVIHFMVEMLQLMEDTFIACQLDAHWNHPLNSGWINTFRRWSAAPTFRCWWPILKGMYCDGFRGFVANRLQVDSHYKLAVAGPLAWRQTPAGVAKDYASTTSFANTADTRDIWSGVYQLSDSTSPVARDVQVCLLKARRSGSTLQWNAEDLFVLPQLGASGAATEFLTEILAALRKGATPPTVVKVRIFSSATASPAARAEESDNVALYKRFGFQESTGGELVLTL